MSCPRFLPSLSLVDHRSSLAGFATLHPPATPTERLPLCDERPCRLRPWCISDAGSPQFVALVGFIITLSKAKNYTGPAFLKQPARFHPRCLGYGLDMCLVQASRMGVVDGSPSLAAVPSLLVSEGRGQSPMISARSFSTPAYCFPSRSSIPFETS